jgi:tetratricopeptide (TPR) repeat protein
VPKLVITGGDGSRREIDLTTRDLRIGRAPENDLSLPDSTKGVSRMHAELRYENGRYVIIDLNSQNGTWLDGTRVQRADVASGSEIAIGPYRLSLVGTGSPEAKTTEEVSVGARTMRLDAPGRPAPPPAPARASAPPPRRAPARPTQAAQAPGPIAALARLPKPVLFGGFFAIALIIIVLGQLFAPAEPAPAPASAADPAAPATAGPETNAQIVERNLTEARTLIEKKDFETAIRDLDRVLLIDPNHAEAADLKMKAQEALRTAQAATPPPDAAASTVPSANAASGTAPPAPQPAPATAASPGAATTVPPVSAASSEPPAGRQTQPSAASNTAARGATGRAAAVETLPSARRPNETPQQWRARNAELTAQYNAARGALDRRSFAQAISGFEALVKAEPGYLDAPQLLARAREESRASGKEAFDAGNKAEAAGNWTVAIENYERAQKVDSSLGAEDAARRVREKMTAAGADAFRRARQFDAVGRAADALKEYANAAQWLPDSDANKAVARQRADQLKAGQK